MRKLLAKIATKRREYGVLGVGSLLWKNLEWGVRWYFDSRIDRRLGIETVGTIRERNLDNLVIDSPNKRFGVGYEPTPIATFRRMMSHLPRHLDQYTFIDLGCGKGRTLAAAVQYGFARVIGVEFSEELCAIAKTNLASLRNRTRAQIEIVNADAADFSIPSDDCVVYLYNPFGPPVLQRVADNIRSSRLHSPRPIYVIYHGPRVFDALLRERLDFMQVVRSGRPRFDPARRPNAFVFAVLAARK
jgi:SAM-dependent methyltransferase